MENSQASLDARGPGHAGAVGPEAMVQDVTGAADALHQEAGDLLDATALIALLAGRFGDAVLTGSCAYDLMAWRDIDIHLPVSHDRRDDWARLLPDFLAAFDHAGVRLHRADFLDDYVDPHPLGAGLYWGLQLVTRQGARWKIDLWGWAPDDFRFRQARDEALRRRLSRVSRETILRLKAQAMARPGCYGKRILSMEIYRFVIEGGNDSLDALEAWVRARR